MNKKSVFVEHVPYLDELSLASVHSFLKEFKAYHVRAAKSARKMVELVAPEVLLTLCDG